MRVHFSAWGLLLFFLCLGGCTTPRVFTEQELADKSRGYWSALQASASQASTPLTLDRAMATAMQNNLDFRVRALESAIASGNRQLATMSMLPTLAAQAGYRSRNNVLASSSESILTGNVSLQPSTSSNTSGHTESLALSWNILDFGLQYFRAREYGEQALIAEEERRRAAQDIAKEVVYYWWMAKGYDEIRQDIEATQLVLNEALKQSDLIAKQRLRDPVDILDYRKALYLIMKRMDRLVLEMNQARNELARLLNLPAGMPIQLADNDTSLNAIPLPEASLREWQMAALLYRPEMRQSQYRTRIADAQLRSLWLELLPAPQVGYGLYHDSNSFLVNNNWQEFSTQISWNLMRLATAPAARKLKKLNKQMMEDREKLQATVVLSQVAVAVNAVRYAEHASCVSRNLADVDNQRLAMMQARESAAALDRLSVIRARVDNLLLRAEQVTDRADYQRARATLMASVGVGIAPNVFTKNDVDTVAQDLRSWWQSGLSERMSDVVSQSQKALNEPAVEGRPTVSDALEKELCF